MATRSARDNKTLNAKHSEILKGLLRRPENRVCADCKRNDPRWASTNLGCFLCIRCSGIHRSMGVHITRIKSIDLDTWTPEQVALVQRWGNKRCNAYWEAHLRPGHMPSDHKMESFIRSKYESKRWAMEGPPPAPETLDDEASAEPAAPSPSASKSTATPPTASKQPSKPSADLLGDPTPAPTPPAAASSKPAPPAPSASAGVGGGLFDLDFSPEASVAAAKATAPAARKDVKNDILSLFSSGAPPTSVPPQAAAQPHQAQQGLWSAGSQFGGGLNTAPAAPVHSPAHAGLGGLAGQFTGMQMSGGAGAGANDPWGSFNSAPNGTSAVPSSPTKTTTQRQSGQFGFGEAHKSPPAATSTSLFGGVSDPWASASSSATPASGFGSTTSANDDLFGGFASGTTGGGASTGAFSGAGLPKNDVFADIWK